MLLWLAHGRPLLLFGLVPVVSARRLLSLPRDRAVLSVRGSVFPGAMCPRGVLVVSWPGVPVAGTSRGPGGSEARWVGLEDPGARLVRGLHGSWLWLGRFRGRSVRRPARLRLGGPGVRSARPLGTLAGVPERDVVMPALLEAGLCAGAATVGAAGGRRRPSSRARPEDEPGHCGRESGDRHWAVKAPSAVLEAAIATAASKWALSDREFPVDAPFDARGLRRPGSARSGTRVCKALPQHRAPGSVR